VASLLWDEVSVDQDSSWRRLAAELRQRTASLVFGSNGRPGQRLQSCAKNTSWKRQVKPVPKKNDGG
jgi:hypothetical protein